MEEKKNQEIEKFLNSLSKDYLFVWNHLNEDQQQLMFTMGADTFIKVCTIFAGERISIPKSVTKYLTHLEMRREFAKLLIEGVRPCEAYRRIGKRFGYSEISTRLILYSK